LKDTNYTIQLVLKYINYTARNIFLTGGAGTGKTTFLKQLKLDCNKELVIVAPTSIAAINAGGVTIHSFFQLPTELLQHSNEGFNVNRHAFSKEKELLMKRMELLVIDEVSMVRADLLDAVDATLRVMRNKPAVAFGGVQLLMVGDLFQLPPVLKSTEMALFNNRYKSPFFFDASSAASLELLVIELTQVYRQADGEFVALLNKIRTNTCTVEDISWLNKKALNKPAAVTGHIIVTTHNDKVTEINTLGLAGLPGEEFKFTAEVSGEFPEAGFPAAQLLTLKKGAPVIFIRNDSSPQKKYWNGQKGIVAAVGENDIKIRLDNEEVIMVEQEAWQNSNYTVPLETGKIEEVAVGQFLQYPLRLAWAITIHKSQGLTFQSAALDVKDAFSPGQVYVALSRLRSLDGLLLLSPVKPENIMVDERIAHFMSGVSTNEDLELNYEKDSINALAAQLMDCFSVEELLQSAAWCKDDATPGAEIKKIWGVINDLGAVAGKFSGQLKEMFENNDDEYCRIEQRVIAASAYFTAELDKLSVIITTYSGSPGIARNMKTKIDQLSKLIDHKTKELKAATLIGSGLKAGLTVADIHASVRLHKEPKSLIPIPMKNRNKKAKEITPVPYDTIVKMVNSNNSLDAIAASLEIPLSSLEAEVIKALHKGEVDISQCLEPALLKKITEFVRENPDKSASFIQRSFTAATLNQVKFVIAGMAGKSQVK
jgi:hypothetical protein